MMIKPTFKRYRGIILVGLPGAGKSTFGRVYAVHSVRTFIDLDRVVEQRAGMTVTDLFAHQGEQAFRELEYDALQSLATRNNFVLSLGGGTLTYQPSLDLVLKMGLLVYLDAQPDVLANRVFTKKQERPLFAECASLQEVSQKLSALAEQRVPQYAMAPITLRTDNGSVDTLKMQLWHFERRVLRMDAMRKDFEISDPNVVEGRVKRWFMSDRSPRFFAKLPDTALTTNRFADKQRKPKIRKPVCAIDTEIRPQQSAESGIKLMVAVAAPASASSASSASSAATPAIKPPDKLGIILRADHAPMPAAKKPKPRSQNPKAPLSQDVEPKTGIVLRDFTRPISE